MKYARSIYPKWEPGWSIYGRIQHPSGHLIGDSLCPISVALEEKKTEEAPPQSQVEIAIWIKHLGNLNKRCYNNTVHHSPLLVMILSIAVQSFVRVIFRGLFTLGVI